MAIKKGLLYSTNNPDGLYPYSQTDCIFDESTEQGLDGILSDLQTLVSSLSTNKQNALTVGNAIDITNNIISNQFEVLNGVDLNNLTYNFVGITRVTTNIPTGANNIGKVIVIAPKGVLSDNPYITQFYMPANNDEIWIRRYQSSGGWRAWRKISDCYLAGDTFTLNNNVLCDGIISGAAKIVSFFIPISKPINATSVTFNSLNCRIRIATGGYIQAAGAVNVDMVADPDVSISSVIVKDMGLLVSLTKTSVWTLNNDGTTPITNNMLINVELRKDTGGTSITFA